LHGDSSRIIMGRPSISDAPYLAYRARCSVLGVFRNFIMARGRTEKTARTLFSGPDHCTRRSKELWRQGTARQGRWTGVASESLSSLMRIQLKVKAAKAPLAEVQQPQCRAMGGGWRPRAGTKGFTTVGTAPAPACLAPASMARQGALAVVIKHQLGCSSPICRPTTPKPAVANCGRYSHAGPAQQQAVQPPRRRR